MSENKIKRNISDIERAKRLKKRKRDRIMLNIMYATFTLILIGAGGYVVAYNYMFNKNNNVEITKFESKDHSKEVDNLKKKNDKNKGGSFYTQEPLDKKKVETKVVNVKDKVIGTLNIPKIDLKIAIYDNTSSFVLSKGVGLLNGTHYPTGGKGNLTALTGHRDLDKGIIFKHVDKLEDGDVFFIDNGKEKLYYKVYGRKLVKPDDTEVINRDPNRDLVYLISCDTPDIRSGLNTHRLIIFAERTDAPKKELKKEIDGNLKYKLITLAYILFLGYLLFGFLRKKKKDKDKEQNKINNKEVVKGEEG